MDRVIITGSRCGIVGMRVCTVMDATDKEILHACNWKNPSGTENGWDTVIRKVDEERGDEVKHLPVDCERYKDRKHFLVTC